VKTIFASCVFQNRFFVVIVVARVALLILNIIRYGPYIIFWMLTTSKTSMDIWNQVFWRLWQYLGFLFQTPMSSHKKKERDSSCEFFYIANEGTPNKNHPRIGENLKLVSHNLAEYIGIQCQYLYLILDHCCFGWPT
jgi:hypothetical protein